MAIDWLFQRMHEYADQPAVVWRDEPYSYRALLEKIDFWKSQLASSGLEAGKIVALEGDYSPNACALLLALVDQRAIAVPLTKAAGPNREEFLKIAEVEYVVALDDADNWSLEQRGVQVTNPLTCKLIEQGEPGLVLFSSGSTGKSKGVLHNFSLILEKFKVLRHRMCTLTFLLLDHIGGINTLFYTLSNGGTIVAVQSRDPEVICQAIERHGVQLLPTSPTFLNMLLISEGYRRYDLSSLKSITYGTEVMPGSTLERMNQIFPKVRLIQTYGLSELGILRSKSRDSNSLWVKVGGESFETKVVDGTLWIRAQSAMMGYLNAPSPFDKDGWMNTEDVVEVDGDYIRILGRRNEIINVGGQKVYPAEVESLLMQMDNIRDVTVYGEAHPLTGNIVVARVSLFEREDAGDLRKRIWTFCIDKLAPYKVPVKASIATENQFSPRYKKVRQTRTGESQAACDGVQAGLTA